MRKFFIILLFCILTLSSCSEFREVENLGFAVLLGADLLEDGRIELTVRLPKINGAGGSEAPDASSDVIYSARGESLASAMERLQWIIPRRLDLSQIQLILISESLASSPAFLHTAGEMMDLYRIYTAARLTVCQGSAKDFIENEKLQIGSRMATELTAMFEDYVFNGYIPDSSFADVYYSAVSIYSDPLAIYAVSRPDENTQPAQPASAVMPAALETDNVESPSGNRFLGAAVLKKGVFTGILDGRQMLCCKLLRGEKQNFVFEVNGEPVSLTADGKRTLSIDTSVHPLRIDVGLKFTLLSDDSQTDMNALRTALENDLLSTIHLCRQMEAEPFGFAERAARNFPDIPGWLEYDWHSRFRDSIVTVSAEIRSSNV